MRRALGAGIAVWLVELARRHHRRSCGRRSPRPRRRSASGPSRTSSPSNPGLPIARRLSGLRPGRPGVRGPRRPDAAAGSPGADPTGDGRPSTSAPCRSAARISAAGPTRASRTTGSTAHATSRATTASASRPPASVTARRRAGMDRFAIEVDASGVLTIDTGRITLGPLPVALGQPGLIPPRVAERMHVSALLGLYPPAWRERYGDEIGALLEDAPAAAGATGSTCSRAPSTPGSTRRDARWCRPFAALLGGGLWTIVATAVLLQPVPPDWPGYLAEIAAPGAPRERAPCPLATLGCALRGGDAGGRAGGLATLVAVVGLGAGRIVRARRDRRRRRPAASWPRPRRSRWSASILVGLAAGPGRRRADRPAARGGRRGDAHPVVGRRGSCSGRPGPRSGSSCSCERSSVVRPGGWRPDRRLTAARRGLSRRPARRRGRVRSSPPDRAADRARPGPSRAPGRARGSSAPLLKRFLRQLGRLVVADDGGEGGGQHQPLLDELRTAVGRGQALDAAGAEVRGGGGEQVDRLEHRRPRSPGSITLSSSREPVWAKATVASLPTTRATTIVSDSR